MVIKTTRIAVHVTPHSGRDEVLGLVNGPNGTEVKVRVKAVPEKGKANSAVCKVIAKSVGVSKSAVTVVSGATSHHKLIDIEAEAGRVPAWLEGLETLASSGVIE